MPEETFVLDVLDKKISDHHITMAFWDQDSCVNPQCVEERDDCVKMWKCPICERKMYVMYEGDKEKHTFLCDPSKMSQMKL